MQRSCPCAHPPPPSLHRPLSPPPSVALLSLLHGEVGSVGATKHGPVPRPVRVPAVGRSRVQGRHSPVCFFPLHFNGKTLVCVCVLHCQLVLRLQCGVGGSTTIVDTRSRSSAVSPSKWSCRRCASPRRASSVNPPNSTMGVLMMRK